MRTSLPLASLLALALAPAAALASPAFFYRLGNEAAIQSGCFGPCACPVLIQSPLEGTFTLDPEGVDGAFQLYRVGDVDWRFKSSDAVLHQVSGSGSYRVSGDQQQLVMDLSVDGGPAERYDSGLTGGGSSFPQIRLPIALNGFDCHDTVYGVQATPGVVGVAVPAGARGLKAGPNPFRGSADIAFDLPQEGFVDLRIHDLAGREIRTLASARFPAGPQARAWDGRDARGNRVPAGVYFVRLRIDDRTSRATIVKVE